MFYNIKINDGVSLVYWLLWDDLNNKIFKNLNKIIILIMERIKKENRGGHPNCGRKKIDPQNKKINVTVYIESVIVDRHGGITALRDKILKQYGK